MIKENIVSSKIATDTVEFEGQKYYSLNVYQGEKIVGTQLISIDTTPIELRRILKEMADSYLAVVEQARRTNSVNSH
jgi:hypothetical protein